MKKKLVILLALAIISCKNPTEKWFNGLADYNELKSASIKMEVLRMDTKNDTSVLNYKLRIYPEKLWLDKNPHNSTSELNYEADSCFFIMAGATKCSPGFVQPVANGIKNCFEFLISFNVDTGLKMKKLRMVYVDKYIDRQTYTLDLEKH